MEIFTHFLTKSGVLNPNLALVFALYVQFLLYNIPPDQKKSYFSGFLATWLCETRHLLESSSMYIRVYTSKLQEKMHGKQCRQVKQKFNYVQLEKKLNIKLYILR